MSADFIKINGTFWRVLTSPQTGTPVYEQTPVPFFPPQFATEEVVEANFPPDARQPYSFRDLSGGGGQAETPLQGGTKRYDRVGDVEGEGVDCTITPEGPIILAANLNTQVHATAGTGNFLGGIWKGGSNNAYFTQGRYVYQWTGAAFSNVGDLGVGQAASDALALFRAGTGLDYWYAALGYSTTPKYSTDSGVTWTSCGTGGGFDKVGAMTVYDGDLIMARASEHGYGNAMLCSMNDGGTAPTIFGVIDPVGDPSFSINRLIAFQGRILVLKDGEGVFMLTSSRRTLEQELFPELRGHKLYTDGARIWHGLLWLPTDDGLYTITPQFTLQHVGPEASEAANVRAGRGPITALDGDSYNLYGFRYAGSGNASFLYKANVKIGYYGVETIAWHPFLQLASGAQCSRIASLNPGGNGPKLLIDFQTSGGLFNLYWIKTPAKGKDPRADPAYAYCAGGTLYYSRLTARYAFANKGFFGITPLYAPLTTAVDGQTATTAHSGRNRYKLDSTALTASSPFGYAQGATQTQGVGVRDSLALRGRGLDVAHRLTTSDSSTTPQLHALTVDYDVEPSVLWKHQFTLDISSGSTVGSGSTVPDPMTPAAALALLRTYPASGLLSFSDLWDNAYNVTIPVNGLKVRPGGPEEQGNFLEIPMYVDVVAIEQEAIAQGTYNALRSFTYSSLVAAGYKYSSLSSI